jgi:hypothetical protein
MAHYLLSVHTTTGAKRPPMSDEQMQQMMETVGALEADMKAQGAWVFSGRMHEPDTATVVQVQDGELLTTDGPFVEAREHLGGFYIVEAADLDAALGWAARVTETIGAPIEVWPFADVRRD